MAQATLCYIGIQLPQKEHRPLIFGPCLLWPNSRPSQLPMSTCSVFCPPVVNITCNVHAYVCACLGTVYVCMFRYSVDASQAASFKKTMLHLVPDLIDGNEFGLWLPANHVMVGHLTFIIQASRHCFFLLNAAELLTVVIIITYSLH